MGLQAKVPKPTCGEPGCDLIAYVRQSSIGPRCPRHFFEATATLRLENRAAGRCPCGKPVTPGLSERGRPYRTCKRCRGRSECRTVRSRWQKRYGKPLPRRRFGPVPVAPSREENQGQSGDHHAADLPVIEVPGLTEPVSLEYLEAVVDSGRVLVELSCILFADVAVLYDEGNRLLPMNDWPADVARAVRSVKTRIRVTRDGFEQDWDVRMHDKLRAAKLLMRFLWMLPPLKEPEPKVDVVGILHRGRERSRERAIAEGRVRPESARPTTRETLAAVEAEIAAVEAEIAATRAEFAAVEGRG